MTARAKLKVSGSVCLFVSDDEECGSKQYGDTAARLAIKPTVVMPLYIGSHGGGTTCYSRWDDLDETLFWGG